MLSNDLRVARRALRRHFGYTAINVLGLAIGLACCTFILLFVGDELSYDRYHANADRVFRVDTESNLSDPPSHMAVASYLLADAVEAEFPEVEDATRVSLLWGILFETDRTRDYENNLYFAEPGFFRHFDVTMLRGSPDTALEAPYTIVVTEPFAEKYFGSDDPIGRRINIELRDEVRELTVTGLVATPPANTHLPFRALVSYATEVATMGTNQFTWTTTSGITYLLLREGTDWRAVEAKLPALLERSMAHAFPDRTQPLWYSHYLQPLTDIRLNTLGLPIASAGDVRYVYAFSTIALLILVIACINYMNLATARSTHRAREVGVRKALGARRSQLARQFLVEAVLLSVCGFVLAVLLVEALLPLFNALTGKALSVHVWSDPGIFAGLLAASLLSGLIAGAYPAFVLSAFRPIAVLRGRMTTAASGAGLRRALVVGQFAASAVLIIATYVVFQQLNYIRTKQLGFDRAQVVTVPLRSPDLAERGATLKSEVAALPGVRAAALAMSVPGRGTDGNGVKQAGSEADYAGLRVLGVDPDYLDVVDLSMATGRFFASDNPTDSTAYVINESAAAYFGWDASAALGQSLDRNGRVFGTFAFLGIFVACLGLFGLATFTAEQRTKEIGIRKVLGASVSQIVLLLSRQFTVLVAIAFVLAAPVAYVVMSRWLEDFAYRIELSWLVFLAAGLTALGIAWFTVSWQALRAATADPVKALRWE